MPRHVAGHRADGISHRHALLVRLLRQFLYRTLGPRDGESVAGHYADRFRVAHDERGVVRTAAAVDLPCPPTAEPAADSVPKTLSITLMIERSIRLAHDVADRRDESTPSARAITTIIMKHPC